MVRRRAFTLIEVLVVLFIVALLVLLVWPPYRASRNAGKTADAARLRQIGLAQRVWTANDPAKRGQYAVFGDDAGNGKKIGDAGGKLMSIDLLDPLCNFKVQPFSTRLLVGPLSTTERMNTQAVGAIELTKEQTSYWVMLTDGGSGVPYDQGRAGGPDWTVNANSKAVLGADRKVPNGAGTGNAGNGSAWDPKAANWTGNVLWGDMHVTWQNTSKMDTQDGTGTVYAQDDIYDPATGFSINERYSH